MLTAERRTELDELTRDERYPRLMAEAAENAGALIVSDAELAALVQSHFGDLEGRITVVRSLADDSAQHVRATRPWPNWARSMRAALDERLGRHRAPREAFACGAYAPQRGRSPCRRRDPHIDASYT